MIIYGNIKGSRVIQLLCFWTWMEFPSRAGDKASQPSDQLMLRLGIFFATSSFGFLRNHLLFVTLIDAKSRCKDVQRDYQQKCLTLPGLQMVRGILPYYLEVVLQIVWEFGLIGFLFGVPGLFTDWPTSSYSMLWSWPAKAFRVELSRSSPGTTEVRHRTNSLHSLSMFVQIISGRSCGADLDFEVFRIYESQLLMSFTACVEGRSFDIWMLPQAMWSWPGIWLSPRSAEVDTSRFVAASVSTSPFETCNNTSFPMKRELHASHRIVLFSRHPTVFRQIPISMELAICTWTFPLDRWCIHLHFLNILSLISFSFAKITNKSHPKTTAIKTVIAFQHHWNIQS